MALLPKLLPSPAEYNVEKPVPPPPLVDRPECAYCRKKRTVIKAPSLGTWAYSGYGYFCSLSCVVTYANESIDKKRIQPIL